MRASCCKREGHALIKRIREKLRRSERAKCAPLAEVAMVAMCAVCAALLFLVMVLSYELTRESEFPSSPLLKPRSERPIIPRDAGKRAPLREESE